MRQAAGRDGIIQAVAEVSQVANVVHPAQLRGVIGRSTHTPRRANISPKAASPRNIAPYCASKSSTSLSVCGRAWQESVKPASISQGSSEKFSSMLAAPSTILQRQVQHMPPAQE